MSVEYSPLKSIELTNFMSIQHGVLEFDDNNIISICGLNDSGKSAVTRAVQIMLYDSYSRDQAKFIKEGADHFTIKLSFEDGVSISKTKCDTGSSVWVMMSGDTLVYTNQLKTGIQAVNDVPEPIKQYLGVLYDDCTDSLINVRRNSDKLFLIDTTGGDNYKILNTVLKSDILAKASIAMNADKNKLNSELQVKTNTLNTYVQQYESLEVAPLSDIEKLRELSAQLAITNIQYMDITKTMEAKEAVDSAIIYDELITMDYSKLVEITNLCSLYEDSNVSIYPEVGVVNIDKFKLLDTILSEYNATTSSVPPEASSVDTTRLRELLNIGDMLVEYQNVANASQSVINEHEKVLAELRVLSEQYNFKICKNCGTVVM